MSKNILFILNISIIQACIMNFNMQVQIFLNQKPQDGSGHDEK